jgi:hypothetical protein
VNKGRKKGRDYPAPARQLAESVSLLLFLSKPKLLQEAQIVVSLPLLDYLAIRNAVDGDALKLKRPASGRAKVLYLSLVRATCPPTCNDLVSFG